MFRDKWRTKKQCKCTVPQQLNEISHPSTWTRFYHEFFLHIFVLFTFCCCEPSLTKAQYPPHRPQTCDKINQAYSFFTLTLSQRYVRAQHCTAARPSKYTTCDPADPSVQPTIIKKNPNLTGRKLVENFNFLLFISPTNRTSAGDKGSNKKTTTLTEKPADFQGLSSDGLCQSSPIGAQYWTVRWAHPIVESLGDLADGHSNLLCLRPPECGTGAGCLTSERRHFLWINLTYDGRLDRCCCCCCCLQDLPDLGSVHMCLHFPFALRFGDSMEKLCVDLVCLYM